MITLIKKLYRLYMCLHKKIRTKSQIYVLKYTDGMTSKSLANVFNTIEKKTTMEEKVWIDRIESLRNELNASLDEILIEDYGAGSADHHLTAEEMSHGKVVRTTISEVCCRCSMAHYWAFLLFKLIRELRPEVCLELGTCLGISTAYQAAALELNQHGKIVTLEGANSLALLSRENFEKLGLGRVKVVAGRFQDKLDEALREQGYVDFALIDGHHDEHATLAYFEQICPFLSEHAVLVFDDISWSKGMIRAWGNIIRDKHVKVAVDLIKIGVCIFARSTEEKKTFKIELN